jgi:hypothetical protein
MKQLRKFEQDAIVNTIVKKVKAKHSEKTRQIVSKKDYLAIKKNQETIRNIVKETDKLRDKARDLNAKLKIRIDAFNHNHKLDLDMDYNSRLSFKFNKYNFQRPIEDKLAIALLETGSTDRLPQIIDEIVKESI